MALRFVDSFDHYAIPAGLPQKWTSYSDTGGSNGITTTTGRRGSTSAILMRALNDNIAIVLDDQQTWIVGFAMYLYGTESGDIVRFYDNGNNIQIQISLTSAGVIQISRNGTLLATSAGALAINVWNYIEIKITIADSGGLAEVRVNESVFVTFTGDTKFSTSLNTANRIQFISRNTDVAFDDLYICDGTGSVNNTYLGDCRVDVVKPTGAGNYAEFSTQGSGNNWDNVDDQPNDGDTSYNYANVTGKRDTFACSDLPAVSGSIFGVQVALSARKDDAGSRTIRSLTRISGTDYEGSSKNLSTDYRFCMQIMETNPNTTAAWADTEINAAEFGYKLQA